MNTKQTQEQRIKIFTNEYPQAVREDYKCITIFTYEKEVRGRVRPVLKIWLGKQAKPYIYYYYNSEDKRLSEITRAKKSADNQESRKAEQKTRHSKRHTLKKGDILNTCWGYEQTNVEFYQVTELHGETMVTVRQIDSTMEQTDHDAGKVMPVKDSFLTGNETKKRKASGENSISINSHINASLWSGKPCHVSWGY